MAALDWIFCAVLLVSVLLGAWRGLVFEVLSLLSWLVALVAARFFALDMALLLPMQGSSDGLRYAVGFVVVFVAVLLVGSLIAVVSKKLMTSVGLRPVDRVLGALFGSLRGGLLLLLATAVVHATPLKSAAVWQESVGAGLAMAVLKAVKPALPRDLEKYLPS
ncbi:MAG: CvpA family protein [Rhodoferax sp.]|jgi:membrane protein required for colicin V production|nr:CvpA family protein [Rhodoferax sp.]